MDAGGERTPAINEKLAVKKLAVRILLRTRLDYLPSPRGTELASTPGPAAGRRVPCEACHRKGKVVKAKQLTPCMVCDGRGWRIRRKGDEVYWDEYTGKPLSPVTRSRSMTPQEIDAALARIASDEAARNGHHEHETFGWERLRKRRDESGSYVELERVLEKFRDASPNLYRYLVMVYDENLPLELTPSLARAEDVAVEWIAMHMPTVRVPRWALREIRELQEAFVREWLDRGADAKDIAKWVGVSRRFVAKVSAMAVKK